MRNDVNVFLNFQLTARRGKLAKAIRRARFDGLVSKETVNANGQFQVLVGEEWKSVRTEEELQRLLPEAPAPPQPRQGGGRPRGGGRGGRGGATSAVSSDTSRLT